ncbi:uncharacterized protein PHALS_07561 [Plasmopara halstedii]|uniref:RxLR-like protein n=1 Tax=Plasmopara halstedii TaxID=4781 RepID=A0A0N7L8G6_PLAHL|nr:uncharacterized protein PHALS_07561 [Plasmopara halstedii]CEG49819.1 hypothetical protein PHALS_07561 [Plasmopara halstedii]|eukprot:XP_024586188.1 hypothetical protein PHALS_07561 [Plasmopara halstedii]
MWPSTLLLLAIVCVCTAHNIPQKDVSEATSDSSDEIYNVCPVFIEFAKEQDNLSNAELKANAADAAMSAYLLSHPNNTLWDYFNIELEQIHDTFLNLPLIGRLQRVISNVFNYSLDTVIALAQMIADVIEWCLNTVRHPLVGIRQVVDFFSEFGENLKDLWGLLKRDPSNTAENMAGGFLLHIEHHMAEFTAESILLIGAGSGVIHGLIHGAEAIAGQLSAAASKTLISVLVFIHAIDDPILIVTPLITSILDMSDDLVNGSSKANVTSVTTHAVKPLETCLIPEEYRPRFSTRDLCLSSSVYVRMLLFGSSKRSVKMTKQERVAAYNRFHDFVCCFMKDHEFEVNTMKSDSAKFEGDLISTPATMPNCSQLMGSYTAETTWNPSASYETAEDQD